MTISRREMAHREATRDPIFLLQRRYLIITDRDEVQYCDVCECVYFSSVMDHHDCDNEPPTNITDEEIVSNDSGVFAWRTEYVYYSRKEAQDVVDSRAHYETGFRVYCVCAEGRLAQILNDISHGNT